MILQRFGPLLQGDTVSLVSPKRHPLRRAGEA